MPANLTFVEAVPGTEGAHYALAQIRGARITAGQDVLVYGATGAIGSAAVQLLKARGVDVTAVCDTAGVDVAKGLGADRVVDYTVTDFTKEDRAYDVVLDAVGKSSFRRCRPLLKPAGIYISSELGPHAENPLLAPVAPLRKGKRVLFPIPKHDQRMIDYFRGLMESGRFMPLIDRTYPLDRIVDAYRYVETRPEDRQRRHHRGLTRRHLSPNSAGVRCRRAPRQGKACEPVSGRRVGRPHLYELGRLNASGGGQQPASAPCTGAPRARADPTRGPSR